MKLRDFRLLTDENIDPGVIAFLRHEGFDVKDVCEEKWQGATDTKLMQLSSQENRVIVTHDADFGTLALLHGEPVHAVLFLRPGHIDPKFTIQTIEAILATDPNLVPPFILVAKRTLQQVMLRIRRLQP